MIALVDDNIGHGMSHSVTSATARHSGLRTVAITGVISELSGAFEGLEFGESRHACLAAVGSTHALRRTLSVQAHNGGGNRRLSSNRRYFLLHFVHGSREIEDECEGRLARRS